MGIGASILPAATSPSDYKARSTERIAPRGIVYCHSCCSFSYQSCSSAFREGGTIYCPRALCRPSPVEQLEEIPASVEGSLRLQAIMLELINTRAATRYRMVVSSTAGLRTQDIILGIDIVPFNAETMHENKICSICSDDFICSSHNCSEMNGTICREKFDTICSKSEEGVDVIDVPIDSNIMKLPCGHIFHESCILPWLTSHQTCPCCRDTISRFSVIPTAGDLAERYSEEQLISKIDFASTTNFGLSYSKSKGQRRIYDKNTDLRCITSQFHSFCQIQNKEELAAKLHALIVACT